MNEVWSSFYYYFFLTFKVVLYSNFELTSNVILLMTLSLLVLCVQAFNLLMSGASSMSGKCTLGLIDISTYVIFHKWKFLQQTLYKKVLLESISHRIFFTGKINDSNPDVYKCRRFWVKAKDNEIQLSKAVTFSLTPDDPEKLVNYSEELCKK